MGSNFVSNVASRSLSRILCIGFLLTLSVLFSCRSASVELQAAEKTAQAFLDAMVRKQPDSAAQFYTTEFRTAQAIAGLHSIVALCKGQTSYRRVAASVRASYLGPSSAELVYIQQCANIRMQHRLKLVEIPNAADFTYGIVAHEVKSL